MSSKRQPTNTEIPNAKRPKSSSAQETRQLSEVVEGNDLSSVATTDTVNRTQIVDPDQLSDALLSAGVDLKEEENLLSSSLHATATLKKVPGSVSLQDGEQITSNPTLLQAPFLDLGKLASTVKAASKEMGINKISEKESDISSLLSVSCEEWLSDIITAAVVFSRHRRRSRNNTHSTIAKALRAIATKDKEREDRRAAQRAMLGLSQEQSQESDPAKVEETQYRAANATALMMTSGKKKYSWLSGSASEGTSNHKTISGQKSRPEQGIKYREAREEPGIALRDLLAALEERRIGPGIEKCLLKGYSRLKG